tara:strand:+ start:536 stop:937 length:402 start_codon:yes stop_codon:yes gene_type:complete
MSYNHQDSEYKGTQKSMDKINYKFNEDRLIAEFAAYIDKTYAGHYGQGGLQSSEVIIDRGHGLGFFLGNVDKYNGRYGKKGQPEDYRKDIVKIIHYGFLALYEHDRIYESELDFEDNMTTSTEDDDIWLAKNS